MQWLHVNQHPRQRSGTDERPPIAYSCFPLVNFFSFQSSTLSLSVAFSFSFSFLFFLSLFPLLYSNMCCAMSFFFYLSLLPSLCPLSPNDFWHFRIELPHSAPHTCIHGTITIWWRWPGSLVNVKKNQKHLKVQSGGSSWNCLPINNSLPDNQKGVSTI